MPGNKWNNPYRYPSTLQQLYQPGFGSDTYDVLKRKMELAEQSMKSAEIEANKGQNITWEEVQKLLSKYPEFEAAYAGELNNDRMTRRYTDYTNERYNLGGDWNILNGFVNGKGRSHY